MLIPVVIHVYANAIVKVFCSVLCNLHFISCVPPADIYHCFCARENDWGYSNFMAVKDMEEKGFVMEDAVVLQARVKADAPHGIKYVHMFMYLCNDA